MEQFNNRWKVGIVAREVQTVSEVYCLIWRRLTQVIAAIGAVNDLLNELVVLLQVPLGPVYFLCTCTIVGHS